MKIEFFVLIGRFSLTNNISNRLAIFFLGTFLVFFTSSVLADTSKYTPVFDSDKSIERYRKLVKKVDGKVVKDNGSYYYHKIISGGEAYFKLLEKIAKKHNKKSAKKQAFPDIKSGSEIIRVQIPTSLKEEVYPALKKGRGLVLPVFKAFFRQTSGINVVFDWPQTEKLHAELGERLKLDLLSLELTKEWAEELRSFRAEGNDFSNSSEAKIIKRLKFEPDFIVSSGLVKDYFENFIKHGNEELNESVIDSLTERLIAGEGSTIEIITLPLLGDGNSPSMICEALNLSELKINNKPKPKTVGDLFFRLEGAMRRSTDRRSKSLEACVLGFEKTLD